MMIVKHPALANNLVDAISSGYYLKNRFNIKE
jgi:hypothetical protein